jgi:uncharacterized membrane protein YqhA
MVGGSDTIPYEYSWQAQIFVTKTNDDGVEACGGSIINSRFILTAVYFRLIISQLLFSQKYFVDVN